MNERASDLERERYGDIKRENSRMWGGAVAAAGNGAAIKGSVP